ncbi:MAG: hypothetical protein JRN68_06295 [Nitrososphaerota archaeon]|jgi:uncharacterized membrane protein|nr:hypothetical protein [Nitrososphaerota archaeon]
MSGELLIILGWLHVFFAVCWIGGAVLVAFVIEPASRRLSPQSLAEFAKRYIPLVGKFMGIITSLTILFGALFYYSITDGRILTDPAGQWNLIMYAGASLGLITYVFGMVVMLPLAKRIERVSQNMGSNPSGGGRMEELMVRMSRTSLVDLILLIAVYTLMEIATYY